MAGEVPRELEFSSAPKRPPLQQLFWYSPRPPPIVVRCGTRRLIESGMDMIRLPREFARSGEHMQGGHQDPLRELGQWYPPSARACSMLQGVCSEQRRWRDGFACRSPSPSSENRASRASANCGGGNRVGYATGRDRRPKLVLDYLPICLAKA